MNLKTHPELVALAQREAATMIEQFMAQDRSTADVIRRALAQSLYAAGIAAAAETKLAALDARLHALEAKTAAP